MTPEHMTILTVDDTPANIRLLTHYLQKQGYRVLTAEDGFEGFKTAIEHHPDLILLDVMMPGTDGYEVCELLKTEEETKDIPVVFLTAKADVEDRIRGFELGAVDYITKPFNLTEIATRVQTQLELRYLHKQNKMYKQVLDEGKHTLAAGVMSNVFLKKFRDLLETLEEEVKIWHMNAKSNSGLQDKILMGMELMARMESMINDWNNTSEKTAETGGEINLVECAEAAVDHFTAERNQNIIFPLPERTFLINGHHLQIQQMLMFLFDFAQNYVNSVRHYELNIFHTDERPVCLLPADNILTPIAHIELTIEGEIEKGWAIKPAHETFLSIEQNTTEMDFWLSAAACIAKNHGGGINISKNDSSELRISVFIPCLAAGRTL